MPAAPHPCPLVEAAPLNRQLYKHSAAQMGSVRGQRCTCSQGPSMCKGKQLRVLNDKTTTAKLGSGMLGLQSPFLSAPNDNVQPAVRRAGHALIINTRVTGLHLRRCGRRRMPSKRPRCASSCGEAGPTTRQASRSCARWATRQVMLPQPTCAQDAFHQRAQPCACRAAMFMCAPSLYSTVRPVAPSLCP